MQRWKPARAGEQGRGFAVVAGEVRSLAQRSAEAAKRSKALIICQCEKCGHRIAQVAQAGESMQAIVFSVRRVTDLIGEIRCPRPMSSTMASRR